jgi:triphosphatase
MLEVELKLAIEPGDLPRLARDPAIRAMRRGRARTVQLFSVYYDTPQGELKNHGFGLRLRRQGARWVQTLKADGRVEGGLHQRPEWEVPCAGPELDFAALAETDAVELVARLRERLQPVFVTEFTRTTHVLQPAFDQELLLCVDRGEIRTGEAVVPISEIELELRSGERARLFELGLALQEVVPLRLENRSKAERGYALLGPASGPVKAQPPELSEQMPVSDAFREIAFCALTQLQANERGMLAGEDIEYLHQMRVAARRLRSAFSVFGKALPQAATGPARDEVKWLGQALGVARDWDVFVHETLPAVRAEFPEQLAGLAAEAAHERELAGKVARDAVGSERYSRLLLRLSAWLAVQPWQNGADVLNTPVRPYAAQQLKKRHKAVMKRGENAATLAPAARHQLRIAVKKLRYGTDFFSSLFPKKHTRDYLDALARLQDVLGALNDAQVCRTLLGRLQQAEPEVSGAKPRVSGMKAQALALVEGWAAGRAAALNAELGRAWAGFEKAKKFW